jgi:O-antigen ligase
LVALGGLAEFVLDVPLWPSDELLQRQGFSDMYIYGTHVRRVYFTFDSPTTLANTLALLLPLALALTLLARRIWARLAAGLAASLMAACIVVTFSRGIWVATAFSLLVVGLLSGVLRSSLVLSPVEVKDGFVRRNWRILLIAAGTLALISLAWGVATVLRPGQAASAYLGVVELSPAAYEAAPVTGVSQELLRVEPVHGEAVIQTWTLLDPIAGRDDVRIVLYEHPPESGKIEIIYCVTVPDAGALRFAIALSPEVWSPEKGDGASFQIYVAEPDAPQDGVLSLSKEGQFVFVRYYNPKPNPSDRRWRNFMVDLSPWAGRTVNLSLITEGGPAGDWAFDWAGWAELQVVSVEPGYFGSAQTENAILRHIGSILDWARDETNRDRLAAWSLALNAWRAAPLWGNGLGSTGVAALRTHPERAFVTESQVLKALVELGLPGLLALAYLWFQIARVGLRAYRATGDPTRQALLLGILTSLLVIFIEGWVYQNLEVKQVNAYFWTLVGTLAFLAGSRRDE